LIQLILLRLALPLAKLAIVVQRAYSGLVSIKNLRRLFAAGFLVFLLAEWGSHGIIYANSNSTEGQTISSSEREHEDPCKTLIQCSDGRRQDQVPSFTHDANRHNGFVPRLSDLTRTELFYANAAFSPSNLIGLFRPPDPLFHPPELN